ncbi:hypothetical protein [Pediococcus ethanolidurans]|uniref:hypothetical protein n=1 Tax=Pediococcus ethanolidurans TaxID=319653 RepID=UPI00345EEC6E
MKNKRNFLVLGLITAVVIAGVLFFNKPLLLSETTIVKDNTGQLIKPQKPTTKPNERTIIKDNAGHKVKPEIDDSQDANSNSKQALELK